MIDDQSDAALVGILLVPVVSCSILLVSEARSKHLVKEKLRLSSVAVLVSRILIFSHLGSRIPGPTTAPKEEGGNFFLVLPFFVATDIKKL
jgi:hypothetical protein